MHIIIQWKVVILYSSKILLHNSKNMLINYKNINFYMYKNNMKLTC